MNAAMPSFWSCVENMSCIALVSSLRPVSSEASCPASITSLICCTASGASAAICCAISSARVSTSASGTTSLTSPMSKASFAPNSSPVRHIFIALYLPTARVRRCVPPPPGVMPILTSGWPKRADSPAMMMSHVIASSQPPPSANPLTAAITGFGHAASARHSLSESRNIISTVPTPDISLMSAPAANDLSLPVSTMQRTALSLPSSVICCASSLRTSMLSALRASGRLMRINATLSAGRSTTTTLAAMANFPCSDCEGSIFGKTDVDQHRLHRRIIVHQVLAELLACHEIVRPEVSFEVGFPFGRLDDLSQRTFPVGALRRAHAARPDHCTPATENYIDALLFPRRHRRERARKALVRRNADDPKLTDRNVAVDVSC